MKYLTDTCLAHPYISECDSFISPRQKTTTHNLHLTTWLGNEILTDSPITHPLFNRYSYVLLNLFLDVVIVDNTQLRICCI